MLQLKCKNLAVGYESKPVLSDINFEIHSGNYICIVGENGSGKSTLMKTLLGLIPPVSGEIERCADVKKGGIGYLPQQTGIQRDFPAGVGEIVLSGRIGKLGLSPFYSKKDKLAAILAMEKTGIANLKDKCYRELSGGQQQRVLLARALCAADEMIVLDEPAAGLDPDAQSEMYGVIDSLNKYENITVVMVTHDIDGALKYAGHILHVGKSAEFMTCEEYAFRYNAGKDGGK